MRKKYICGNWKMNKTIDESKVFADEINNKELNDVDILIAAPFTNLKCLKKHIDGNIKIAAQNVSQFSDGAYTGEISTGMLKAIGVFDVIIGHSERREIFGENDDMINAKVKRALDEDMNVILCVGETEKIRDEQKHFDYVSDQLKKALRGVRPSDKLTIAYEPIWAIGTGKTCEASDAEKMCANIRKTIKDNFGDIAQDLRILYGGSVKPNNANKILGMDNIDGVLVGGASLDVDDFVRIINYKEQS